MHLWRGWQSCFCITRTGDNQPAPVLKRSNEQDFRLWLNEQPGRAQELAALTAFLQQEGVADIVPVWTLARGDSDRIARCKGAGFFLPPHGQWPNILPALRIIRAHVIPAVGRGEVISVYRTPDVNTCANGAKQSRHLTFSALDMVAPDHTDSKSLFQKLCAAWHRAGPKSGWGFGAYFDPDRPTANAQARFHVDGTGWRSWGFSKSSGSSGCRLLGRA